MFDWLLIVVVYGSDFGDFWWLGFGILWVGVVVSWILCGCLLVWCFWFEGLRCVFDFGWVWYCCCGLISVDVLYWFVGG